VERMDPMLRVGRFSPGQPAHSRHAAATMTLLI
jgi:hypothetical protein